MPEQSAKCSQKSSGGIAAGPFEAVLFKLLAECMAPSLCFAVAAREFHHLALKFNQTTVVGQLITSRQIRRRPFRILHSIFCPPYAATVWTTFRAASAMESPVVIVKPDAVSV